MQGMQGMQGAEVASAGTGTIACCSKICKIRLVLFRSQAEALTKTFSKAAHTLLQIDSFPNYKIALKHPTFPIFSMKDITTMNNSSRIVQISPP